MEVARTIECAGWITNSCSDGPGIRSVLFLQGCSKNCKGCQNSRIKEHGKGRTLEIETVLKVIDANCRNKKITISGGEPLEQMDSLLELLTDLKKKSYDICVYTGWELKQVPQSILKVVNYLKTGAFIQDLLNTENTYVGLNNQHMYQIINDQIQEIVR